MTHEILSSYRPLLRRLYAKVPLTVDELVYTDDFDRLYDSFVEQCGLSLTKRELHLELQYLRKKGLLPVKRRPKAA